MPRGGGASDEARGLLRRDSNHHCRRAGERLMSNVSLDLIDPNPFRDFELHPIDPGQVERLKASIGADGFWASVVARKVNKRYQLAFGHHRIEAARGVEP